MDRDGDGEAAADDTIRACEQPENGHLSWSDCNDNDPAQNSSAEEICDGIDNDCDGSLFEGELQDWDRDGAIACLDCNDYDITISPFVQETCDGVDNNCDNRIDEEGWFYADDDADGFGTPVKARAIAPCGSTLKGYVENSEDCDDEDSTIHPLAQEICDDAHIDEDCDGLINYRDRPAIGDCGLYGDLSYTDASASFHQESPSTIGLYATIAGDINNDGYRDILLGNNASGGDYGDEMGYIFLGPVSGSLHVEDAHTLSIDSESSDGIGRVTPLLDLNFDGYDDIAINSYIFMGPISGDIDSSDADQLIFDETFYGGLSSMSSAQIFDADKLADIAVGNSLYQDSSGERVGAVFLHHGPLSSGSTTILEGFTSSYAGTSVDGNGDINDDGHSDLLIGAPGLSFGPTGIAFLIYGPISDDMSLYDSADATMAHYSYGFGGQEGTSLSTGDTNHDGYDDVLIGAPYSDNYDYKYSKSNFNSGSVYLIEGPVSGAIDFADADARIYGDQEYSYIGMELSSSDDINDDGHADIVIGTRFVTDSDRNYIGATFGFYGPIEGTMSSSSAPIIIKGDESMSGLGASVSTGDTNNDGYSDLLIGASRFPSNNHGSAYLFLGQPN